MNIYLQRANIDEYLTTLNSFFAGFGLTEDAVAIVALFAEHDLGNGNPITCLFAAPTRENKAAKGRFAALIHSGA